MSSAFQITNGTKPNSWPIELLIKKIILIKSCARNHITRYGIINGANGNYKKYT
jgi:hypothetical protein